MQGIRVRRAVGRYVPEQQGVALTAPKMVTERGKVSLPTCEIVVKVEQKRGDALPLPCKVLRIARRIGVKKIKMGRKLLAGGIMQDCRRFQTCERKIRRRGYACAKHHHDEVGFHNVERDGTVRARFFGSPLARPLVIDHGALEARTRT